MKNQFYLLFALSILFAATAAYGQDPPQTPKGASCLPRESLSIQGLNLSEAQRAAVRKLDAAYSSQINSLQNRLLSKRLELQAVFADPETDEATIRAKALEVSQLDGQCRQLALDYRIAIRAQLTPDQLHVWCASAESCFMKGWTGKP